MQRVYLSVINDLVTDQRAHRIAQTLHEHGALVTLIGRRFSYSQEVGDRDYKTRRFRLMFNRRFLFYACYNLRLFIYLLFRKKGILTANDLDTLPASWLVSRIRNLPLVFDSHEYFTEVPELINRKFVRNFWLRIEKALLPRVVHAYTVSEPIATEYYQRYNVNFKVVRNLPFRAKHKPKRPDQLRCDPRRIIIYQGALNPGRGLEYMILAMRHLDRFIFHMFGDGPLRKYLQKLAADNGVSDRVIFMGRKPFNVLKEYTRQASVGISLEENIGKNYYYSLPNKLFDYIQAGIPVLVADLPEMKKIVAGYNIGMVADTLDPARIAAVIEEMMNNHEKRIIWKKNLRIASRDLCWENEYWKLLEIYRDAGLEMK